MLVTCEEVTDDYYMSYAFAKAAGTACVRIPWGAWAALHEWLR